MTKLRFAEWLEACQPERWTLQVRGMGTPFLATIPLDESRDVVASLVAAGAPTGSYSVQPILRSRGRGSQEERERLGMASNERAPSTVIRVRPQDLAAPTAAAAADDEEDDEADEIDDDAPTVRAARVDAARARHEAERAEYEAQRARHDAERREAEAKARQFAAQAAAAAPAGESAALVILRTMLDQQGRMLDELRRELIDLRREARYVPPSAEQQARPPLEALKESLALLAAVREVMQQQEPPPEPEPDSLVGLLRELPRLRELIAPPPPNTATAAGVRSPSSAHGMSIGGPAAASPSPAAPAAAAPAAPAAANVGTDRVRRFVETVCTELVAGTDPEAVAEATEQEVSLLPLAVRRHLDAGDWSGAWSAIEPMLTAEERAGITEWIGQPPVQQWLNAFAAACAVGEEVA